MTSYSTDCKAMSGTPRPPGLCKLHSKSGLGQFTGENVPVEIGIPKKGAVALEEGLRRFDLVIWAVKVDRKAASREAISDLGFLAPRSSGRTADTGDHGTYKITTLK